MAKPVRRGDDAWYVQEDIYWKVTCRCRKDSYVILAPEGMNYFCVRCERQLKLRKLKK